MTGLGLELILLLIGIIFLIKGSDLFVDSGSAIGKVLRISEILVGMTIVAFGTSLPEFVVGIASAQGNSTEIALRKYTSELVYLIYL